MNYQEWQHSDFPKEEKSCQSCHMPAAKGPIRIASELGDFRESLSRHVFVGGNAFMVRLMSSKRAELGVEALPQESEATAKATVRQLQEDTATLAITEAALQGTTLNVDLDVRNLTGHKFPTGYPSRRTWLHVTVRDAQGRAVFESGAINPNGSITGNDSDADATKWEPHYAQITRPDQVQIYEPILGDRNGAPTTGLLTATQYLKDNRLLPRGFVKATADAEVGVYGDAKQDGDFDSSGDKIRYAVTVPGGGPYRVEAELLYQTIGYRWAHNLERYDAREPKAFLGYYTSNANLDGKFRRVSVTLKGNTQASLDFRQGYYAGKQFGKFNTQEKERQLEEALMLQDPVTELTLALEINYFQLNRAEYFVPMALKVPGSELALARKGGAERTLIDFIGEINLLEEKSGVRALRPEKIRLVPAAGARLVGKIETANYLGGSTLYRVRGNDGRTLLARFLRRQVAQLKVLSHSEVPDSRDVKIISVVGES